MRTPGQSDYKVAILGPGAVGGFLACLFWRKGIDVTCIAHEQAAELLSKTGLKLESATFGNFVAFPKIVTQLDQEQDLLIVATKAPALTKALERLNLKSLAGAVVIPLLNGIEHMQILRTHFGQQVVAASIGNVQLKRVSPEQIVHSTKSCSIKIAAEDEVLRVALAEIAQLFSDLGIEVELVENERELFWDKLVRLNALACTTAASNKPLGYLRNNSWWRKQLLGCVQEAVRVASCEGVNMNTDEVMAKIDNLPADLSTSMQRDIASGKPSELDAISGAVIRAGKRFGLNCPTISSLIDKIREREVYA